MCILAGSQQRVSMVVQVPPLELLQGPKAKVLTHIMAGLSPPNSVLPRPPSQSCLFRGKRDSVQQPYVTQRSTSSAIPAGPSTFAPPRQSASLTTSTLSPMAEERFLVPRNGKEDTTHQVQQAHIQTPFL